jgi:hypothetical protein
MKTILSITTSFALLAMPLNAVDTVETIKAGASATAGAAIGYGTVAVTGMTCIGCLYAGAGCGAPAGPVGIVVGAIGGLAAYGLYRACSK